MKNMNAFNTEPQFKSTKENVNNNRQKTNLNERSNSVDIHMRNGPSFADHHLSLKTKLNPSGGNVTVTRYKVPQIPFQEKWDWINKYAPEALEITRKRSNIQEPTNFGNLNQIVDNSNSKPQRCKTPTLPLASPKSPTSPVSLTTPSPTPSLSGSCCMSSASSSSSSGCYSGSCSPTPPPSRLLKNTPIPTHL